MSESSIRPNIDTSNQFLEAGAELTDPEFDEDEDIHVCKRCNLAFKDIQKYLAHKVKHDNYKIRYCRSEVDKRMIMPKLIYKPTVKKETVLEQTPVKVTDEKENEGTQKKKRRGRKKIAESINQDLVIKDKPVYVCNRCDRKFNREATLRRHNELEHEDKDDEEEEGNDDDDYNNNEDDDAEYKPSAAEVKSEIEEDSQEAEEMPPLTAEEMAEVGPVDGVVVVPPDGVIVIPGDVPGVDTDEDVPTMVVRGSGPAAEGQLENQNVGEQQPPSSEARTMPATVSALLGESSPVNVVRGPPPPKRHKISEEVRDQRKFVCQLCGNKFKEINVLKTHMLVHSTKREYVCDVEGCTYAFKTKGSLRRHMRRHTGERPFPCELCGRTFVESGALTRHLRSRVPCTAKSDNDLPRYGKRWGYTPNIPAAQGTSPIENTTTEQSTSTQQEQLQSSFEAGQTVTIAGISVSAGSDTLATVVQVLDSDLPTDEQNLIKAVIDNVTDNTSEFVQNETEIDTVPTACRVCNEDFLTIETLKVHLRTHLADDALKCWLCHFITDDKDQFTEHMFTQHAVQLQTSDPFTTLVVADSENKDHRDIHKNAQIAVKQLLDLPVDRIDGEEPDEEELSTRLLYKCPVCMRKFRGSNYLKLHMRNHTGLRPHKCSKCDKSFITKDTLNKHMNVHVEDRNFKCGECGKLFKRLSHVREHIKTHSATRLFPCHVCEKAFKTNNAMKVHLRTHTDILPYVCNYCHRRFREKGSVVRHKRIHTGEKPYECKHCGRCFAEHGTLNRHLKAKVSCKKTQDDTVLAEFSSVVADTQQYIVPQEGIAESGDDSLIENEAQQAAEFFVVQTDMENQEIQNVEIVSKDIQVVSSTDGTNSNLIEGVQVSDNLIVITDPESGGMKIIDSRNGETVAFVPVVNSDNVEDNNQTVLVSADAGTEIEAVAMAPLLETETEDLATVLTENTTCVEIHELPNE